MSHGEDERREGYSIGLVTKLTGLTSDTVRAWERRHEAVAPLRTGGNTRKYSAGDVRRLTLLQKAVREGHRISDIARLADEELEKLSHTTARLADEGQGEDGSTLGGDRALTALRREYLEAISRFEAREAQQMLSRAAAFLEPTEFVLRLLLPIMRDTGDRWHRGEFTVAQEHLVSMQQRALAQGLLLQGAPHPGAPRIMVATTPGEKHEFGALAGAMLASIRGYDTLYLGTNVPIPDLEHAIRRWNPDILLLSLVRQGSAAESKAAARDIEGLAEKTATWVGLPADHPVSPLLTTAKIFTDFAGLDAALTEKLS